MFHHRHVKVDGVVQKQGVDGALYTEDPVDSKQINVGLLAGMEILENTVKVDGVVQKQGVDRALHYNNNKKIYNAHIVMNHQSEARGCSLNVKVHCSQVQME